MPSIDVGVGLMKKPVLPIAIATILSITVGISLAIVNQSQSDAANSDPALEQQEPPQSGGNTSEPSIDSNPVATDPGGTTPADHPSATEIDGEPQTPTDALENPDSTEISQNPYHERLYPIEFTDQVEPSSEFALFRQRFIRAVETRNAAFVGNLIPDEGVNFGFGGTQTAVDLELYNENARFWAVLEKALAVGCETEPESYFDADPDSDVWICPNVTKEFYRQYPDPDEMPGAEYEFHHLIIVGENVNVREQPTTDSPVIGVLSNEIVETDQAGWQEMLTRASEAELELLRHPIQGWRPVVLSSGRRGYVYNRYVYAPLDPRLVLGQVNGEWRMLYIQAGD